MTSSNTPGISEPIIVVPTTNITQVVGPTMPRFSMLGEKGALDDQAIVPASVPATLPLQLLQDTSISHAVIGGKVDAEHGILTLFKADGTFVIVTDLPTYADFGQAQVGPPGNPGLDGQNGADGIDGDVGTQGCTGERGPTGPRGPDGLLGLQGVPGPTGNFGPYGTQTAYLYQYIEALDLWTFFVGAQITSGSSFTTNPTGGQYFYLTFLHNS